MNAQYEGGLNTSAALSFYNCTLVASYNWVNGNSTEQTAALNWAFNGSSGDFYTQTGSLDDSYNLASWPNGSGSGSPARFAIEPKIDGIRGKDSKNYSGSIGYMKYLIRRTQRQLGILR